MKNHVVLAGVLGLVACACGASVAPGREPPVATPTAPRPGPALGCVDGVTDGAAPLLHVQSGAELSRVRADGSRHVLHRFDAAGAVSSVPPASRGGYVLARAQSTVDRQARHHLALLDPAGALRWERHFDVSVATRPLRISIAPQQAFVGADGRVVLALSRYVDGAPQVSAESVEPDGRRTVLEGWSPTGPADERGVVPVQRTVGDTQEQGAWTPATQQVTAVERVEPTRDVHMVGAYRVHVRQDVMGVFLERLRDGVATRIALPFASQREEVAVVAVQAPRWVLLGRRDATSSRTWRVDLDAEAPELVEAQPPAGLRELEYVLPTLDADGALLAVLRDEEWGRLWRSDDGRTWSAIGRPMTGTIAMEARGVAGTYVIEATDDRFLSERWPATVRDEPDGLRGPSLQVSRPSAGRTVVLAHGVEAHEGARVASVQVSPNGRCVAWAERATAGQRLTVLDLEQDRRAEHVLAAAFAVEGVDAPWR